MCSYSTARIHCLCPLALTEIIAALQRCHGYLLSISQGFHRLKGPGANDCFGLQATGRQPMVAIGQDTTVAAFVRLPESCG